MDVLLTAGLTLFLVGAQPAHPQPAPLVPVVATTETDLPPTTRHPNTDVGGRLITYFSTACCGSMVCGGCSCVPFGILIPLALAGSGSLEVILVGVVLGLGIAALGTSVALGGGVGYSVVLIMLHSMGLWDSDAAAQGCNDVINIFSICLSVL